MVGVAMWGVSVPKALLSFERRTCVIRIKSNPRTVTQARLLTFE